MTIGEKIQKCRKERKMSQEELASGLGVSRQAVSKWELNESVPDTENVIELGRIFQVSLDYLLKTEISETEEVLEAENDSPGEKTSGLERERAVKSYRRPAFIAYVVICILIIAGAWYLDSTAVGIIYILDITFLWGMGYLIWLLVKALRKYVQK